MARLNAGRPLRDLGARDTSHLLREHREEFDRYPFRVGYTGGVYTVNLARPQIRSVTRSRSAACVRE